MRTFSVPTRVRDGFVSLQRLAIHFVVARMKGRIASFQSELQNLKQHTLKHSKGLRPNQQYQQPTMETY